MYAGDKKPAMNLFLLPFYQINECIKRIDSVTWRERFQEIILFGVDYYERSFKDYLDFLLQQYPRSRYHFPTASRSALLLRWQIQFLRSPHPLEEPYEAPISPQWLGGRNRCFDSKHLHRIDKLCSKTRRKCAAKRHTLHAAHFQTFYVKNFNTF